MKITVFGSSASKTPKKYLDAAYNLGILIAEQNHICVNGGGNTGVMGALNEGVRSKNGEIIGVIHSMFCVDKNEDTKIKNMIYTDGNDLTLRKQGLLDNGDIILVLPGGVGTFDELWDTVCGKSLGMKGLHHKPICIINIDNYFEGSILQLKRAHEDDLLYQPMEDYFHVEMNGEDALQWAIRKIQENNKILLQSKQVDDDDIHNESIARASTSSRFYVRGNKNIKD